MGWFFLVLENIVPSTPDIIRDRWHGRCSERKKKKTLLGEPRKNKQEGQRKSISSLCCQNIFCSCKMSNCIPQDCTLQKAISPLSPLIALLEFMAHSLRRLIFVYWISRKKRKAKSNLIHDAKILWECYCWFSLAQLLPSGIQDLDETH